MVMKRDFTIIQGSTFRPRVRFAQAGLLAKAITAITRSGRAVVTVPAHGLTTDWSVYVRGITTGMRQINSDDGALDVPELAINARYVDANTLKLDLDSSAFQPYVSGGEILYYPPYNLTNYIARAQLRPSVGSSTILKAFSSVDGSLVLGGANGLIDYLMSAAETSALATLNGVHDLEIESSSGVVRRILEGDWTLSKEVTR